MINEFKFKRAIPVWKKDDTLVMNQTLLLSAEINALPDSVLYITGCSSYLVFVNGNFVAHGPARTAKGYYKVDILPLDKYLTNGTNIVTIRAAGYNANSFCYIDAPSFICAEILSGGTVVAATGFDFNAVLYESRLQKVPRYSYQRTFCEVYTYGNNDNFAKVELVPAEHKMFLVRDVPYCDYETILPKKVYRLGKVGYSDKSRYYNSRYISGVGDNLKGFTENELEFAPHVEYQKFDFLDGRDVNKAADIIEIQQDSYADLVFDKNSAGLISFSIESENDATVFVSFDEILIDGKLNPFRLDTINVLTVNVSAGTHKIVTAEPYVMKYMRITAKGANVKISRLSLIEIAFPKSQIICDYKTNDADFQKIYDAAQQTFCTNVVDIYMDCASRERAGWLCDSFFMGRSEQLFTGKSDIERAFLQAFLLPEKFENLPDGMLPMCYPADVINKEYIPNWAMWYALHLYEYYCRSADRELVDAAQDKLYSLLSYFKNYENEYGLLEKLPGWIFIEWSKANSLVQDVSFPTNMLYAAFKSILAELYSDGALKCEANTLRRTIVDISMTPSGFFCDNAVRIDGKLVLSGERTEVCQYYAFWFKCATPQTHPELWKRLLYDFGRNRKSTGEFGEIHPANAFIGNYLRLDLLMQYRHTQALTEDVKAFFLPMCDKTGSLWEHMSPEASCSHGFASYVAYILKML